MLEANNVFRSPWVRYLRRNKTRFGTTRFSRGGRGGRPARELLAGACTRTARPDPCPCFFGREAGTNTSSPRPRTVRLHARRGRAALSGWRCLYKSGACLSNRAGPGAPCQPKENAGQDHPQPEEVQTLTVKLRHIGDSVHHRAVQEVRTGRGLPGWGGRQRQAGLSEAILGSTGGV